MRIIFLNIDHGNKAGEVISFILSESLITDIFCLQEADQFVVDDLAVKLKDFTGVSSGKKVVGEKYLAVAEFVRNDMTMSDMAEIQDSREEIGLAEKFDRMTKEISQLLALFETTARTFAKAVPLGEYEKDKEFLEKIDKLLDQNKTLAKGLTIVEERLRERVYGGARPEISRTEENVQMSSVKRPLPKF